MKEIKLPQYIQSMLIPPSLEVRVAEPTLPLPEPTLSLRLSEVSPVHAIDKGKGVYVFPKKKKKKKKAPTTRPTGIVIGASTIFVPSAIEEEEEPMSGDVDISLPATDIPVWGGGGEG